LGVYGQATYRFLYHVLLSFDDDDDDERMNINVA